MSAQLPFFANVFDANSQAVIFIFANYSFCDIGDPGFNQNV
jgi:hypothetical protein